VSLGVGAPDAPQYGKHASTLPVTRDLTGGELAAGQRQRGLGSPTCGPGQRLGPVCQLQWTSMGARHRVYPTFVAAVFKGIIEK
jgi:hypothetical protein